MSFKNKVDYFGLADTTLDLVGSDEGKSAQEVTALGSDGSIVASEVFGVTKSPSCSFELKAALSKSFVLGGVTTLDSETFTLGSVSITTAASDLPKVSASGEQVQNGATAGCKYTVAVSGLAVKRHAQILFTAFTLSGDGCHLVGADYTIDCAVTKSTKNGDCIAFDVGEGKITASVTIRQTGSTAPTLTAGSGWSINSPLTESNPDSDYPTFTATLVKYLAKDAPSA